MTIKIVAEIGSSPAPEWDFAAWCDAAQAAGATDVKAQLFRAEHFPLVEHASKRALEFPRARLGEFVEAAHARGLDCGVSVFDTEAVTLAAQYCDWLKLAAREQDNAVLAATVKAQRKPVFRSVSHLRYTLNYYGWTSLFAIQAYPAPMIQSLYRVIRAHGYWSDYPYRIPWGWSSHTPGLLDCILAARLGASVIEKHLAIDPNNIEAGHSLSPHQFKRLAAVVLK